MLLVNLAVISLFIYCWSFVRPYNLLAWYEQEFASNNPEVQAAMSRTMHATSALPFLSKIEAPVLGLYPSAGPITSDQQMALLERNIRNLRVIWLRSTSITPSASSARS